MKVCKPDVWLQFASRKREWIDMDSKPNQADIPMIETRIRSATCVNLLSLVFF